MKILKMIGLVVAAHAVVLTFGFILPGCQSAARISPSTQSKAPDPNLTRIDAARASNTLGQPAQTPASSRPAGYTPPPSGPAFAGGPVTDFSTPAPGVSAPLRPQAAADSPALAAAEPAEPPAMLNYTVVSGDSASKIAKKFKIKTDDLLAANNLTSRSTLQIGQKLKIPAKSASSKPGLAAQPGTTVYKVQPNDSLGSIARRHNTTVEQIQSLNKLSGATIRVGQELLVPPIADAPVTPAQTAASSAEPAAAASAKGTTITHTVKPGENLDGIARHYGVTVNEIGIANHITDPRRLQAGQKLVIDARKNIPAGTPATTPAAASTTTPAVTGTAQSAQPAQTTPPPIPSSGTSPISPISPVIDSPITPATDTPAYDNPPVNTPIDPVSTPVGLPQS